MNPISIQSFVYDGYVFYYTDEAIEHKSISECIDPNMGTDNKTIGFYFDLMGFPSRILLKSSYGVAIMRQYNLRHPNKTI